MPTRRNYLKVRNKASLQYCRVSVFFSLSYKRCFYQTCDSLNDCGYQGGLSQAITARFIASSGDNPSRFPFFSGLILPPSFGPRMGPVNNTTLAGFHLWAIHGDRLQWRWILKLAFFFLSFLFDFSPISFPLQWCQLFHLHGSVPPRTLTLMSLPQGTRESY